MNERQAYIAFNLTENVGSVTVSRLAGEAGSVAEAWARYPKKVSRTGGAVDWEREERLAEQYGVTIVTRADEAYPAVLRQTPGTPLVLYVKGDVRALSRTHVALVGTRRATAYGLAIAGRLAEDLAVAGLSVVSGLALGIDAAAHRGALAGNGVTVGVIGSGLDRFYPEQNRDLAREIVRSGGAVVSEFAFGRSADTTTFPIRNHVVAALSRGVVAVEAPLRSGTLITTDAAAELGRTVMAVPGRIDSRMSAGCLKLIRDGAILVRHADDVLEALGELLPHRRLAPSAAAPADDPERPPCTPEEALVLLHVDEEGVGVDELVHLTKLPVERLNAVAMALRLKGVIRFLPGNRIMLCRG